MVDCGGYSEERRCFIREVISILGQERWTAIIERDDGGVAVILGVAEKIPSLVEKTKSFLQKIWKERDTLMNLANVNQSN